MWKDDAMKVPPFLPALMLATSMFAGPAGAVCSVSVPSISFGSYDTVNAVSTMQSLTVTCDKYGTDRGVVSYSVGSGSYAARTMASATTADTLQFNLYQDAAHTQVLGDGTSGTVTQTFRILGNTLSTSLPVYAYLPGGQNVAPGNYASGMITVTVSY